jgi:superfamily II DNA or RNA helicase
VGVSVVELIGSGLRELADEGSLTRGRSYAEEGRVTIGKRSADAIHALVQGSALYAVELSATKGRLRGRCTCPVSLEGRFCKHCVAVALSLSIPEPEQEAVGAAEHFRTDADLEAFIAANGLGHVRQLGAEVLLDFVPERERSPLRYVLTRQGFLDVATPASLRRFGYALAHAPRLRELLPPAAFEFLHREAAELARARADAERLQPPDTAEARTLFDVALASRAAHGPELAPRPREALGTARLRFTDALPGFVWADERLWRERHGVPAPATVELLLTPERAEARCSLCPGRCVHTLAALDTALLWLKEPLTDERRALLDELRQPPWERALRAIDRAIETSSREARSEWVAWRLEIDDERVRVEPWLHRLNRRGAPSAGTRVTPSRLLDTHAALLSPQDQRIAAIALRTYQADRSLLMALVGHPRLFLAENPSAPVQVEAAKVGLFADHRGESVVLVPALDGAPLPDHLQPTRDRREPLFYFEEASRKLVVLDFPEEVRRTLEALTRYGNDFPPESHGALVEKLSTLSARVPVAMPRSVMGESVVPQLRLVLRLELQPDRSVRLELRVRPLPESATFPPAEGARDVHVRREGKPLHARREFAAERAAAEALWNRLQVPLDLAEPFVTVLPDPQRALALLATLEGWTDKPELEWISIPLRVVGSAQSGALKVALERKRDWFGLNGGLSMDGERVTLAVLLDAARRKERFVQLEGERYVEIGEALRRHLERLSDHTHLSTHGLEIGPSGVEALSALEDDGARLDTDHAWQELATRIFAAKELRPRVPAALKTKLRDYQVEGFRWLTRLASWGAGAVLADDMGLGKTVQALALLLDRARLGPALVVAPTSVGFNWVDEARRFAPSLRLLVYAESEDRGGTLEALGPRDVLVVSYGLLARDATRLSNIRFATLVFDEAQALKNAGTHRARAARALQGDFKVALSGTPLENHLGELWSLYRVVFPGLLGSWDAFRDRFATPIEKRIDPTAAPALARVLQPFLLRRTKDQVARELPPRTDLRVPVVLSPEEWQLYEDARLAALSELETPRSKLREQQRRVQVLAALTRLRLLASHPRLYDARSKLTSSKLERLLELVEELLAENHRALVFSQFTSHLALVREALDARGTPYLYLDGETPRAERAERVRRFQEGSAPLFLISLKAGGFGLNLTGADNVIHLDPWWNPAVEDQASDRAHRIGQDKPVTVYRLVAKGTIEEQILALHDEKRELVMGVLEGKDQAARLSNHELLALLSAPAARLADVEAASQVRH